MKMAKPGQLNNLVRVQRMGRGWSQQELADNAGLSRAAVSAIEIQRLVPSVAAALALARVFESSVEELFGARDASSEEESWAWPPPRDPCPFWRAHVAGRILRFPTENTSAGMLPHDGIY